jgi:hypothetical protein
MGNAFLFFVVFLRRESVMKSFKPRLILSLSVLIALPQLSHAAFIDAGGGMIYDTLLDVTWLQDANYAATQYSATGGAQGDADGLMNWNDATTWAASLTVGGVTGWRLPTMSAVGSPRPNETGESPNSGNEIGWLWYQLGGGSDIWASTDISPFTNLPYQSDGSEWYWTAMEYDATSAGRISMNCACWDHNWSKSNELYAWAVHSGDVAGVPEPSALLLMLSGFAGLGFAKWRDGTG